MPNSGVRVAVPLPIDCEGTVVVTRFLQSGAPVHGSWERDARIVGCLKDITSEPGHILGVFVPFEELNNYLKWLTAKCEEEVPGWARIDSIHSLRWECSIELTKEAQVLHKVVVSRFPDKSWGTLTTDRQG